MIVGRAQSPVIMAARRRTPTGRAQGNEPRRHRSPRNEYIPINRLLSLPLYLVERLPRVVEGLTARI